MFSLMGTYQTTYGIFVPFYEFHNIGISPEIIPHDLDFFFQEYYKIPYQAPPAEVISYTIEHFKTDNPKRRIGVFEKLARNGIPIVYGDVNVGRTLMVLGESVALFGGSAVLTAAMVPRTLRRLKEMEREQVPQKKQLEKTTDENSPKHQVISRRNLLKVALYGAAAWVLSPIGTRGISMGAPLFEQQNAVKRILERLHGLQSNFHPEDFMIFFRNVVMADKLLIAGESIAREQKRRVKGGFGGGSGHAGIEDFLRLGKDFCRDVITSYPRKVIETIVAENGGIENFCSIRLFTLPRDFKVDDLTDPNKTQLIKERRIYDEELIRQLKAKLQ